jgi:hypothetical protein
MAFICECCNHVHQGVKMVLFEIEFIENHLSDFCNRPVAALTSISDFAADRRFRGLVIWTAVRFGGFTQKDIGKKYRINQSYSSQLFRYVKKFHGPATRVIEAELNEMLKKTSEN